MDSPFELDEKGRKIWPRTLALTHWKPVPDPDKPDLPYRPGFRLSIRRYVPIPPFGHFYSTEGPARFEGDRQERYYMRQSEWCLMRPPSTSSPHPDPTVSGLQIIDEIACKDGRGAQLVRCRLDADPGRILVAKIYDAFYYHPEDRQGGPCDATRLADNDYSREASAYEVLRDAKVDGQLVPKYYGSWTFNLPVPKALQLLGSPCPFAPTRPVRMILYEWIKGVSIYELIKDEKTVKSIPPELRLEILAKGMEALCIIESLGVRHNDWAPRNVMVSPASGWTMSRLPAVFLIDFNVADLTGSPYYKRKRYLPTPLPISPRYRFFHEWMPEFGRWIPRQYREGTIFNGWLATRWGREEDGYFSLTPEQKEYYYADDCYQFVPLRPESPPWTPGCGRPHDDY
ncbi:hypothetical protein F503_04525 [Ophiostoma piceae UAMH 11346]|uniref:Protein kinase domain-containing protein n=1 Tax=Ophiostoma piceae (strain UAMH 11346) TaxID=1262450 RepID=S3CQR6_OPHP1|nr:hypothetical protein F503_04525 [Ophiostoma piceae UAMH 11346]